MGRLRLGGGSSTSKQTKQGGDTPQPSKRGDVPQSSKRSDEGGSSGAGGEDGGSTEGSTQRSTQRSMLSKFRIKSETTKPVTSTSSPTIPEGGAAGAPGQLADAESSNSEFAGGTDNRRASVQKRRTRITRDSAFDIHQDYWSHAVGMNLVRPKMWIRSDDPSYFKDGKSIDQSSFSGAQTDRSIATPGRPTRVSISKASKMSSEKWQAQLPDSTDNGSGGGNAIFRGERGTYIEHGYYVPAANLELQAEPQPPAPHEALPDFAGQWLCTSTAGAWEAYLRLSGGIDEQKIKLAKGTRFGAGLAVQEITTLKDVRSRLVPDHITICNSVVRTSWVGGTERARQQESTYDGLLKGVDVTLSTGDVLLGSNASGVVRLGWEGKALVTRYQLKLKAGVAGVAQVTGAPEATLLPVVMKRSLVDDGEGTNLMIVKLMVADMVCLRVYARIDEGGDYLDIPHKTADNFYRQERTDRQAKAEEKKEKEKKQKVEDSFSHKKKTDRRSSSMIRDKATEEDEGRVQRRRSIIAIQEEMKKAKAKKKAEEGLIRSKDGGFRL